MHTMMIKANNVVQCAKAQCDGRNNDDGHDNNGRMKNPVNNLPMSITRTILERNWKNIFAGVVTIDIAYIDDSLIVFDMNFLARFRGTRICARKEPDFF